ncbi:unnamed protein product, partial [marine sediment metagenome]
PGWEKQMGSACQEYRPRPKQDKPPLYQVKALRAQLQYADVRSIPKGRV